jgi:hypothetical protein
VTLTSTIDTYINPDEPWSLEQHLEAARCRIEVDETELDEARRRRRLLSRALENEFTGSKTYINGSVAHGDALTPLTDVDLGVIVEEAKDTHGPGKRGCSDLQERAANTMRAALKPEFPDASVEWRGHKRSVLVRFRKPVDPTQEDFTADVIVAINNSNADGLFIPNYLGWDRSHPQKHTALVKSANKASRYTYARVVRLLKHWNRRNGHPLCSWNIKALALATVTEPTRLIEGLMTWFDHAVDSLGKGATEDPAGVAEKPIAINKSMTLPQVVDQLEDARDQLHHAARLERQGWPLQAQEQLAKFFNDEEMMPMPDKARLRDEFVRRFRPSESHAGGGATGAPVVAATAVEGPRSKPAVRSWNPLG